MAKLCEWIRNPQLLSAERKNHSHGRVILDSDDLVWRNHAHGFGNPQFWSQQNPYLHHTPKSVP